MITTERALPVPFVLSGDSDRALRARARNLRQFLETRRDVRLVDLAFTLTTTGTARDHRAAVVAGDRSALTRALSTLAQGGCPDCVLRGVVGAGYPSWSVPWGEEPSAVLAARSFVSGARVDWATLFAGQGAHSIDVSAPAAEGHWLAELAQDRPRDTAPPEPAAEAPVTALRERLSQLPASAHRGVLLDAVRALAAQVLESDVIRSEPGERTFQQLGFSSLTAVEFRDRLGTAAGVALSATVIFDHPSLGALAEHVGAELGKDPTGVAAAALTALAALETTVRGLDESPELRAELADRLAALLAEVAPAAAEAPVERDIDDATSEEMLAYLDQKFLSK